MKPYHISKTESPGMWVDLEAIQTISDVYVAPEQFWIRSSYYSTLPPASFSIQFAFQNEPKVMETFERLTNFDYSELENEENRLKREYEIVTIEREIIEFKKMHEDLVAAWLATRST